MDIQLNDYIRVSSDEQNIVVLRRNDRTPDEKSAEVYTAWQNAGYFRTLEGAFSSIVETEIKRSDATTFQALRDDVAAIKKLIADALAFTHYENHQ